MFSAGSPQQRKNSQVAATTIDSEETPHKKESKSLKARIKKRREKKKEDKYLALAQRAAKNDGSFSELTDKHQVKQKLKASEEPAEEETEEATSEKEEEDDAVDIWMKRAEQHAKLHKYPVLNILILIVGSRGDVQPFISFAHGLQKRGHKVRLATHKEFEDFVTKNGVDFHPLGGDPKELMAFMVKHPDMITFDKDEIKTQRKMMAEIFDTVWEAAGAGKAGGYRPDVIISNPPVQVHVHVAAALQVPLQIMFTMPWSPTDDYVHPLSPSRASSLYGNKRSYWVVDELIWMGMRKTINNLRVEKLGLEKYYAGSQIVHEAEIPHIYCMSPSLALKPKDWGSHIDVVGFWILGGSGDTGYTPPKDLLDFLEGGDAPIYIGFGSIVVDDPDALTKTIFDAVKKAKVRAIISKGWGGIGGTEDIPDNIYLIGPCPHSWLFERCFAVCHHGGAGTTATGLVAGKPTIIVPFFGDQPFWGHCVHRAKCGPNPIPIKELTSENLAEAIEYCKDPKITANAVKLGKEIANEDGVEKGVACFHQKLPINCQGEWVEEFYEYGQYFLVTGWISLRKNKLLNRYHYMDRTQTIRIHKKRFVLPDGWEWTSEWTIDKNDQTDSDGWRYSFRLNSPSHKEQKTTDRHRYRRWYRTRKQIAD